MRSVARWRDLDAGAEVRAAAGRALDSLGPPASAAAPSLSLELVGASHGGGVCVIVSSGLPTSEAHIQHRRVYIFVRGTYPT